MKPLQCGVLIQWLTIITGYSVQVGNYLDTESNLILLTQNSCRNKHWIREIKNNTIQTLHECNVAWLIVIFI